MGKLSDERFAQLSTVYEQEQSHLKAQNTDLQLQLKTYETDSIKADRFIEIVRKYTQFEELTTAMLNEFVERIDVHEADKTGFQREQQVDIHLNFIGQFELPFEEAPPTAKELEEAEERKRKLTYQREANRRWYNKKRQEVEWQRALEAGEISETELESYKQQQKALEEAETINREKRKKARQDYAAEWARKKRARLKAEREAQLLLHPEKPDEELTPEELKARKYQRRKEREKERQQQKRDIERAERMAQAQ